MKRDGMKKDGIKRNGMKRDRMKAGSVKRNKMGSWIRGKAGRVLLVSIAVLILTAGFAVFRFTGAGEQSGERKEGENSGMTGLTAAEETDRGGRTDAPGDEGKEPEQSRGETEESGEAEAKPEGRVQKDTEPEESVQKEAKTEESVQKDAKTEESVQKEAKTGEGAQGKTEPEESGQDRTGTEKSEPERRKTEKDAEESLAEEVEAIILGMKLEEKVAQMFFVTPELITGVSRVRAAGERTKDALAQYPVGGLIYLAANLENPEQTEEMLSTVQKYMMEQCGFPIFLGVDEEGGRVLRIGSNAEFGVKKTEAMGTLAGKEEPETAVRDAGDTIGAYLSELGFNVDFAPDADVLTNKENRVIGDRSFGKDPQVVAGLAWEFAQGLHDNGIMACYKHFPGHGDTVEDSHKGYAYSYKTWEELAETELIPFRSGSEKGIEFIMVSHISLPKFNGTDIPATLSKSVVTGKLREEMGYEGIIITDSMNMGAVSKHYASGEAAVLAVQAGCDMLLMSRGFEESYRAVLEAVEAGEITEERIDESVRRIMEAKLRWRDGYGDDFSPLSP